MSEENESRILGPGDFVADCEIYGGALRDLVVPPGCEILSDGALRFRPGGRAKEVIVVPEVPSISRHITTERGPSVYVELKCRVRGTFDRFTVPRSFITTGGRKLAQALGSAGVRINASTAGPIALWLCLLEDANVDVIPEKRVDSRYLSVGRDGLVTVREPEPEGCPDCGYIAVRENEYCDCAFSEGEEE